MALVSTRLPDGGALRLTEAITDADPAAKTVVLGLTESVVGERFHLKPLLPPLSGDGRFYVLALSLGSVRLWEAWRHTIDKVDLEDALESPTEALRFDDPEKQLQCRAAASQAAAVRAR